MRLALCVVCQPVGADSLRAGRQFEAKAGGCRMQAELVAPAYDPSKAGKDGAIVDRNLLTSFLRRYSSSGPTLLGREKVFRL